MIRRPPRSTQSRSSAASDVYKRQRSIVQNLEHLALDPNGVLHQEPVFLLREELHEPRSYFALLQAIAAGNKRLNEIAQAAGVERAPASRYLATLIDLGVVERAVPVTELHPEKSRKGIYIIADGFLRFWFRFVAPFGSLLATGQTDAVLSLIHISEPTRLGMISYAV